MSAPLANFSPLFFKKNLAFRKNLWYDIRRSFLESDSHSEEVSNMAKCEFCDKGVTFGIQVSHSHRRSNRTWKPNVKRVKAIVNGTPTHVYVCTRCLRSGKVTRAV
jgi:large subunit ribosomal protein L28